MGIKGSAPWSANETQLACALWIKGYSARRITCELGTGRTRNAVIGHVYRKLGVASQRRPETPNTPALGRVANAKLRARLEIVAPLPLARADDPVAASYERPEGYVGKRFGELKAGECRYIENEPSAALYCCAPAAASSSYCPAHRQLCYQPGTAWRGGKRTDGLSSFARHRDAGAHYVVGWSE